MKRFRRLKLNDTAPPKRIRHARGPRPLYALVLSRAPSSSAFVVMPRTVMMLASYIFQDVADFTHTMVEASLMRLAACS